MTMAEYIDIFDANLALKGSMERVEAHRRGEWHKTFHCWVLNCARPGGAVLFQLRSAESANFPNMVDISAAGHIKSGESVEEGVREVAEELGIPVTHDELISLGYRIEVADQPNGQHNREYQAVFVLRSDLDLNEYSPQVEEVAGLLWVGIDDGLKLFSGTADAVSAEGIVYDKNARAWRSEHRKLRAADFLPRIQKYYLTILIMAERLRGGGTAVAIS